MTLERNYSDVKANIKSVCERVGRNSDEITIVAVSKTIPISDIMELNQLGQINFGENRVIELRKKYFSVLSHDTGNIHWHLVGHLQTNKVKDIISFIHLIHSVDSVKLAQEINTNSKKINRIIDILVQVNTSNEKQKSGVSPDDAKNFCKQVSLFENVRVKGLMTIAKLTDNKEEIRKSFKTLKSQYDEIKVDVKDFEYLSMGMSNDYEIALEEGANMLRIGSSIFGERRS